jgi:hypothetical protein
MFQSARYIVCGVTLQVDTPAFAFLHPSLITLSRHSSQNSVLATRQLIPWGHVGTWELGGIDEF